MAEKSQIFDVFKKSPDKERVLILGGGFAGIETALRLDTRRFEVLLLDRHNYFTFQPLLYQVATGGLEPDSIAYPLRQIVRRNRGVLFRVAEIESLDPISRQVVTSIGTLPYDHAVIATGSMTNFFGDQQLQQHALSLKQVRDALDMRSFILQNFEEALLEKDPAQRASRMNFVIVGAGPTGVEIAGALAELKRHVLPHDYPELDFADMHITLVESSDHVLNGMSDKTYANARAQLEALGVQLRLGVRLSSYDGMVAKLNDGTEIRTSALLWTAGVKGAVIAGIPEQGLERGNRIRVDAFNRVAGADGLYAIGDVAAMTEGGSAPHPMLGPVAMQQGKLLAKNLNRPKGQAWQPFVYKDRGTMATIGRSKAVAELAGGIRLKGFLAWMAWLFIHLVLLVGFRNRVVVFFNWIWNYFSYDRAIRLIIRPYKGRTNNS